MRMAVLFVPLLQCAAMPVVGLVLLFAGQLECEADDLPESRG
jgi:hypothetical protein